MSSALYESSTVKTYSWCCPLCGRWYDFPIDFGEGKVAYGCIYCDTVHLYIGARRRYGLAPCPRPAGADGCDRGVVSDLAIRMRG